MQKANPPIYTHTTNAVKPHKILESTLDHQVHIYNAKYCLYKGGGKKIAFSSQPYIVDVPIHTDLDAPKHDT